MTLPAPFLNGQEDDDRELWQLLASVMDSASDRQRVRGLDREPLDNLIEAPIGQLVDMHAVVAEQSQLKEDVKRLTAVNNALYGALINQAVKIKRLEHGPTKSARLAKRKPRK